VHPPHSRCLRAAGGPFAHLAGHPVVLAGVTENNAARACTLFSAAEMAAFLKSPSAQIDEVNSGVHAFTKTDMCNWFIRQNDPHGLTLKIREGKDANEAELVLFSAAASDEEFSFTDGTPIRLGDQAVYKAYGDGTGGTVIARKGKIVFTVTGSAQPEVLITCVTQALGRLDGMR
jgi:hypothetical protein